MNEQMPERLLSYGDPSVDVSLIAPDFIENISELEIIKYLSSLDLNRRGSFVDAGAHIGFYSVYMSKIFTEVFSFEPSPFQRGYLQKNKDSNNLANVTIFSNALGENTASASLYVMGRSGGSNTLCKEVAEVGDPMCMIDVEIIPLDALRSIVSPVSIIKIDVEGFEIELLKGARETICQDRPLIVCEVWQSEPRLSDFKAFLIDMGYSCEFPFKAFPEMSICHPI